MECKQCKWSEEHIEKLKDFIEDLLEKQKRSVEMIGGIVKVMQKYDKNI